MPVRVTAPVGLVVTLADMKAHLRVLHTDDDAEISALMAAAEAHLDGWRGVLGRCILSQQWAVDYPCAGCWRLPFPDVQSVTASVGTADLSHDRLGSLVTLSEAATVTMTVQMPDDILPVVQQVIRYLVAHWYSRREAAADESAHAVPFGVDAMLAPIRWVRV